MGLKLLNIEKLGVIAPQTASNIIGSVWTCTNKLRLPATIQKYDLVDGWDKCLDQNLMNSRPIHFEPQKASDFVAHGFVKFLRFFADIYFGKDYVKRAIALETVAAIPGIVGGLHRHLWSLRNFEDNGVIIKRLLEEAENERQHLLSFLKVGKLSFHDRLLFKLIQPVFFSFYMIFYLLTPGKAHRFVGYLEEEAVRSYNSFEREIVCGRIPNVPAPHIAINYWKLGQNARLLDLVRAVRMDEIRHRDANHDLASN